VGLVLILYLQVISGMSSSLLHFIIRCVCACAIVRIKSVGGGHMPWSLQQCIMRPVSSSPRTHSDQLRGQEHSRLGHDETVCIPISYILHSSCTAYHTSHRCCLLLLESCQLLCTYCVRIDNSYSIINIYGVWQ